MTKTKAIALKTQIKELCKKHGLWVEIQEKHKPELKDITLTISMKVTDK